METPTKYPTYWAHDERKVALVRIDELTTEEWSVLGRPGDKEFNHGHKRTTFPDVARLEEYIKGFRPSNLEEYWQFQFDHKSFDQHFHTRANNRKQQLYDSGRTSIIN